MQEGSGPSEVENRILAKHVPELDGIRGLAVLSVMLFHQTVLIPVTSFDRGFVAFSQMLQYGVDLFFVLSGYLITGILYYSKPTQHYYRNFYARRTLRIFPLYYLILFLAFVVLPSFQHSKAEKWGHTTGSSQIYYWLFLSNWFIALSGFGPRNGLVDLSWTLAIEEQFYLTWPVIVRSFILQQLQRICYFVLAFSVLTRILLSVFNAPTIWSWMLTPAHLDGLAIGSWIALASRVPGRLQKISHLAGWILPASLLLLGIPYLLPSGGGVALFKITTVCIPLIVSLACGSFLILSLTGARSSLLNRMLRSQFLTLFGVFSYALYLFHNPVQALLKGTLFPPSRFPTLFGSPLIGQLGFYIIATAITLPLAWLSWHLYEKRWLTLKRFFTS